MATVYGTLTPLPVDAPPHCPNCDATGSEPNSGSGEATTKSAEEAPRTSKAAAEAPKVSRRLMERGKRIRGELLQGEEPVRQCCSQGVASAR